MEVDRYLNDQMERREEKRSEGKLRIGGGGFILPMNLPMNKGLARSRSRYYSSLKDVEGFKNKPIGYGYLIRLLGIT